MTSPRKPYLAGMTVATEACYAERSYTGVETVFSPGFSALSATDVLVGYFDSTGVSIQLTKDLHFSVALDGSGAVTVTKIAFPSASPATPVTLWFFRHTPATQGVDFDNLGRFDPSVHERLADAAAMRDAELRSQFDRDIQPFTTSSDGVDFRPRVVRAADPVASYDLATKAYADLVSGSDAAGQAAASALAAAGSATAAAGSASAAAGSAASAATNAALLASPDYGFFSDAPSATRDYGSTWT
ncbi:hypothetical protein IVB40_07685 [Bradyrhizobium sp. 40]|uniref:hypothetical protein n=1 Tax=Bradyrhizobium sp. 40 TaxID=2782674 RepID=UPI001FFF82C3|nr:hypothetical protein [Bradyrhizobium sp. 40]UPJ43941.1 hypothetical protein IVB40_07685 [Bradyrhizobium sp. 40]